jgi:hypothetical protein
MNYFKHKKYQINTLPKYLSWMVILIAIFFLLAWGSWGKLPMPLIDVGHEVEIPARILDGQILYRDLGTYYGPLSYYANALFMLLFGKNLKVFYSVGIILSLAATLLFYRLALQLMETHWAAICTITFICYCAVKPGILNYVVPYSYGAVYAIVFCLLSFNLFGYYISKNHIGYLIACAIFCGLATLSKQEFGISALGSILTGILFLRYKTLGRMTWQCLIVVGTTGVITYTPLALIARQISWGDISEWLMPISKSDVLAKSGMLALSPVETIRSWISSFKIFFSFTFLALLATVLFNRILKFDKVLSGSWLRFLIKLIMAISFFIVGMFALSKTFLFPDEPTFLIQPLADLSWSLPAICMWVTFRHFNIACSKEVILTWILLVFSLLLNARWLFRIPFYGMYAPSVVLLFFVMANRLAGRYNKLVWRYLLIFLLIGLVQSAVDKMTGFNYAINSSYGTFYSKDPALAHALNQTLTVIKNSKASSVLVLPEGNIINFMTNTHSPSRELNIIPGVLLNENTEQNFIDSFKENPPEIIVYVDVPFYFLKKDYQNFSDYNPIVHNWIINEHRLKHTFPISPTQFPWHKGEIKIFGPGHSKAVLPSVGYLSKSRTLMTPV